MVIAGRRGSRASAMFTLPLLDSFKVIKASVKWPKLGLIQLGEFGACCHKVSQHACIITFYDTVFRTSNKRPLVHNGTKIINNKNTLKKIILGLEYCTKLMLWCTYRLRFVLVLFFIMKALKRAAACSLSLFNASSVISILVKLTNCRRLIKTVYFFSFYSYGKSRLTSDRLRKDISALPTAHLRCYGLCSVTTTNLLPGSVFILIGRMLSKLT